MTTNQRVSPKFDQLSNEELDAILRMRQQQLADEQAAVAADNANTCSYDEYDPVNHPTHYVSHPSGIECIQITEHMSFCLGNAVKYLWRASYKDSGMDDLRKAIWYVEREIARIYG